jgi:alkylation response protein AidB-like acyl-CoA dehydrogenase
MNDNTITTGGEFLVKDVDYKDIFIPEEFGEEENMILQTCYDFLDAEIIPNLEKIDKQEDNIMRTLIEKAGELGLLGIAIPEEYEGFNQSFLTTMHANVAIGSSFSYAVAYMAHTGIGTLPLLYFGNEEQKQKYIPKMASGEMPAAYCLTEPNAGSDANSGSSKATLSEDGKHYILNGQKMWITNGGFADMLTVFAKIDNDRVLSAFLVEADWEGVTVNPEEKKMGIKGSSTTQLFFSDVKVPVENMLGRRGEGFRIALQILHIGRIKLAANSLGSAKRTINYAVNYSNERKQFGKLISSFGAIQHKLAEQVIRTYAVESSIFRASKNIDDCIAKMSADGVDHGKAHVEGSAQYAVECALLKVYGSEMLDYVVDEAVQIYGGMGFSADMPVDRAYRDSRINRIFEGTNEINRLLVVDTAIKDAQKGKFDLFGPAEEVMAEVENLQPVLDGSEDFYTEKKKYIKNFKKAILMTIKSMSDKLGRKLGFEQEIMMNVTDMMIQLYGAESTLLRVEKLESIKGEAAVALQRDILDVVVYDAAARIEKSGKDAIFAYAEEDADKYINALKHFTCVKGVNTKENRRRIAAYLIEENKYKF